MHLNPLRARARVPALAARESICPADGNNLLDQHLRVQGIDFGYFGINAYSRPINFGFALTAKY